MALDHLQKHLKRSVGRDRFEILLEKARSRHGELVDSILPVFEEDQRLKDIIGRRTFITSSEHRFFLALLLNISSKAMIFDLIKRRFPEREPIETVLDWVMDLSTIRVWGSDDPNVLGLKDFNDQYLFVLEGLLRDHSLEHIKDSIEREYPADQAEKLKAEVDGIASALRSSALFKAALAD
jgi:hypothetical protein